MKKIVLLVILLLLSGFNIAAAEIFKCVDQHGKVSYSDHHCGKTASSAVFKANIGAFKQEEKAMPLAQSSVQSLPSVKNLAQAYQSISYQLVLACYAIMSVLCYLSYFLDKRAAEKGLWRIPEKTLHSLELLGGWPGGLLAQRTLRHKNRKPSYQVVFWLIVGLHIVGLSQLR